MTQPNRIGKYEVTSVVRSAPFGQQLSGHDPTLDRAVTIWAVHESAYDSVEAWKHVLSLLSELQGPSFLQLLGQEEVLGWRYVVLEDAEATPFSDFVQALRVPDEAGALRVGKLLGAALTSLHDKGLALGGQWSSSLFLDKTANPYVDPLPCCLLAVFEGDTAPSEGEGGEPPSTPTSGRSPGLSAKVEGDIADLAELVGAVAAGSSQNVNEWASAQQATDPHGIGSVVARALSSDPAKRFVSVSAFVEALEHARAARRAAVDRKPTRVQRQTRMSAATAGVEPSRTERWLSGAASALGVSLRAVALLVLLLIMLFLLAFGCVMCGTCGLFAGI